MQRKLNYRACLRGIVTTLLAASLSASAQQQTVTHSLGLALNCLPGVQGFCPSGTPTFPIGSGSGTGNTSFACSFTDPTPSSSRVVEVKFKVTMQRLSWGGNVPQFTVELNGAQVGTVQSVVNWGDCNWATYTFTTGLHEQGVPGYTAGGTNSYEYKIENSYGIISRRQASWR